MALQMSIAATCLPLHQPTTTSAGKFYDAMVVEVILAPGRSTFVPVFNYGAGRAARYGTGGIVLGTGRPSLQGAASDMNAKHSGKTGSGYSVDPHAQVTNPGDIVPSKVRQAIEGTAAFNQAAGVQPTTPVADPAPKAPAKPRPKKLVQNAAVIEQRATAILTMGDPEAAVNALRVLQADVEKMRDDMADAESAFEMATLYVHSRLQ